MTIANPEFNGVANTMMYTVSATADDTFDNERHTAVIGFTTRSAGPRGSAATNCPADADYTWSSVEHVFDGGHPTRTWTLYNFQPDTKYSYLIRTGTDGNYKYKCGALETDAVPMPTLPASLAALNLTVEYPSGAPYFTKYVMFDTDDCDPANNYILAIDADTGKIVWYLDIPAVTGIPIAKVGGWRFQPQGEGYLTSDRIIATISANEHRRYLFELELDGTIIASKNFDRLDTGEDAQRCDGANGSAGPCPHHDAWKSDLTGETHVLVSENSDLSIVGNRTWNATRCTDPPYRFVGDGWQTLSEGFTTSYDSYLIDDLGYDPDVVPGPHAPAACATAAGWRQTLSPLFQWIDWTHTNSLAGTPNGEYLDLSLKEWDQIIRVRADGTSTSPVWRLASDPAHSDFGTLTLGPDVLTGEAAFGGQHDVHAIGPSTYMLFDNQGNRDEMTEPEVSRVLSIAFDFPARSATIDKSWAVVDNDPTSPTQLSCPTKGSGQLVTGDPDGNSVLALCRAVFAIEELNEPSGMPAAPSLFIHIPEPPTEVCGATDGASRAAVNGWYRAYPLETLGDFF